MCPMSPEVMEAAQRLRLRYEHHLSMIGRCSDSVQCAGDTMATEDWRTLVCLALSQNEYSLVTKTKEVPVMRALSCLTALVCLGALGTLAAPAARAGDWSLHVGVGVPEVVYVAPAIYASPTYYRPRYYGPAYYPHRYCPPAYYRRPLIGYYGYADRYHRYHGWHRWHDRDDD
jgi:hypothetical protein